MPENHDTERSSLLYGEHGAVQRIKGAWAGFRDFALRDNVLEVAVGLVIAAAFTSIVNSLVSDILLPPISLLPILDKNLPDKFAVLRWGGNGTAVYNTLAQAHADGAVTLNYGIFLEKMINFIGLGVVLYLLAQLYTLVAHDQIIKYTTKCINCRKEISVKAKRCAFCTSWQDNRENP